jgi:hypothetical protein
MFIHDSDAFFLEKIREFFSVKLKALTIAERVELIQKLQARFFGHPDRSFERVQRLTEDIFNDRPLVL